MNVRNISLKKKRWIKILLEKLSQTWEICFFWHISSLHIFIFLLWNDQENLFQKSGGWKERPSGCKRDKFMACCVYCRSWKMHTGAQALKVSSLWRQTTPHEQFHARHRVWTKSLTRTMRPQQKYHHGLLAGGAATTGKQQGKGRSSSGGRNTNTTPLWVWTGSEWLARLYAEWIHTG